MAEYIDKEELLRNLKRKIEADNRRRMAVVDSDFIDLVNDATVIEDVVEVVRCKDCIHYQTVPFSKDGEKVCISYDDYQLVDEQYFCSCGKRREQK